MNNSYNRISRTYIRLRWIFIGIFALANVGILIWTLGWARPAEACAGEHKWWDGYSRVCAQPILTSDITGRVISDPKARAEALKAIGRAPPPQAPKP